LKDSSNQAPHPLRIAPYRWYWIARILAMLAQSNLVVALGWLVYDAARETLDMRSASLRIGLIGLAQFVPVLLFNPVAGLAADRFDRRFVVRLSLLGQAAAVSVLCLAGRHEIGLVYAVAVGFAGARAFYMPAMNALAPALVPVAVLPRAIALSAVAGRIGGILGPVLGGYAYALGGTWAFALSAALLALAFGAQCMIRIAIEPHARADGHPLTRIVEGMQYVVRSRVLLGAISLDLFAVLFGGATALLPAYARDILMVGPTGLGLLRSASSVGAVTMAIWLSAHPLQRSVGPAMFLAVAIFGAATCIFGLSSWLWLSLAMLVLLGAADMVSVYVRQTMVQVATPDAMRGRIGATSSLFITASNELGELESGLAAAWIGPVGAVVAGGVMAMAIAGLWSLIFPQLRRAQRFDDVAA
jgi:MFS family permease